MKKNLILIFVALIALNFAACRDTKKTDINMEEVTPEIHLEEIDEMEVDSLSIEEEFEDIDLENNIEE